MYINVIVRVIVRVAVQNYEISHEQANFFLIFFYHARKNKGNHRFVGITIRNR